MQTVLLFVMVRRGLHRQFPIFFLYTCYQIVQCIVMFTILRYTMNTNGIYAYAYTVELAISTALRFGIIGEILTHLSRNYSALERFKGPWLRWMTLGLLFASLVLAFFTHSASSNRFHIVIYSLDRTASFMQSGLLFFLLIFCSFLGLFWRNHVFGLTLGMGIFSSVELIASTIQAHFGPENVGYIGFLTLGTYHVCVLIWIVYFLVPERVTQNALKTVPDGADLEEWNQELQRLIGR